MNKNAYCHVSAHRNFKRSFSTRIMPGQGLQTFFTQVLIKLRDMKDRINQALFYFYANYIVGGRRKLCENKGAFLSDQMMALIIVVVIAGVLIVALIAYNKDTLFPNLERKTEEFFAMT